MSNRIIIGWVGDEMGWQVDVPALEPIYCPSPEIALSMAKSYDGIVVASDAQPQEKLIQLVAAAVFSRSVLYNMKGVKLATTPVADATVSYLTRKELGKIIPDGWMIELQLNRYAACFGEQLTLPARRHLASALEDIKQFLTMSISQAATDLLEISQAQTDMAEMEQLPMWLSSDRP
jgi:hypothetical protein